MSLEDLAVDIVLDRLDDLFTKRRRNPHEVSRTIMKEAVLRAAVTIAESVNAEAQRSANERAG